MMSCSRLELRLAISAQSRNWRSLERHRRTSVNRLASQSTAIALADSPGLALMKASSTACGSYAERLLEIGKFRRDFHRGPRLAHGLEINARRLAGTGAVAIPFIENQPRRRHQIEHGGDHAAVKPAALEIGSILESRCPIAATAHARGRNRVAGRTAHCGPRRRRPARQRQRRRMATRTGTERKNRTVPAHSAEDPAPSPLGG